MGTRTRTTADRQPANGLRRRLAEATGVRLPVQHGVMVLALLGGAVLGVVLAGEAGAGAARVLPPWLPAGVLAAAVTSGGLGALLAGLAAWLVCRPRRARQWTLGYPRRRTISLHGGTDGGG